MSICENTITVEPIYNKKLRILERVGGETQKIKLKYSELDVKLKVLSKDSSILKVTLEEEELTLIPLAEGKTSVEIIISSEREADIFQTFQVEIKNYVESGKYKYKNIPIPGGGFVTGFVFHPTVPNILYCRTDIGGNYRYDFNNDCWISLIDHATDPGKWETYPLSIALDKNNPSYIYSTVGENPIHKITFSEDYGAHLTYLELPKRDEKGNTVSIHGNAAGRSTGERLVVDSNNSKVLYLGTMEDGLWKTSDRCKTWKKLKVNFPGKAAETNISFIEINPLNSNNIIVGTNGKEGSPDGNIRGASVYTSNDGGESFKVLEGAPEAVIGGPKDHPGYVGQRAAFVGNYLFVTYSAYNIGWSNWNSYGCDTGLCYDGAVYRFLMNEKGEVIEALDITPLEDFKDMEVPKRRLNYGMSGISADVNNPGTLICSTITSKHDTIYRTTDYGLTWKPIMAGLEVGKIDFNVPYQKVEHSGNNSCIHWMADVKINPFDSNMALFNTGLGIFMTRDLTEADKGNTVNWACADAGVEETVHLNLYNPPSGDVKLIDILGDYGGFVFTDLDKPAENTFANASKDRWVTAMNADYPDSNPQRLIATPRGNWTGQTKGGLIISYDQGKNWQQLKDPVGLSEELDQVINTLKNPNNTSGWAAISADGETIVWAVGAVISATRLVYTNDLGENWTKSKVYDKDNKIIDEEEVTIKIMADRVNPNIFYGFGKNIGGATFYISKDKGESFKQISAPKGFPQVTLSGIDSEMPYEIRVESGKQGVIWMAMQQYGLWRINYDLISNTFSGEIVSAKGDYINRIGFGKAVINSDIKMLFTSGTIGNEYGFWRSEDGGRSWTRVNDDLNQFGDIRSITGDSRVFGRIYVGTGTRGVVYGDPIWKEI